MSAVTWAKTVQCDFPGCKSVGEVTLQDGSRFSILRPDGWIGLQPEFVTRTVNDLCPIHAGVTVAQLVTAIRDAGEL